MRTTTVWALLGVVVLSLSTHAVSDEPVARSVTEVRVTGNDQLSRNAVLSYVKTRPGTEFDLDIIKADRDRLMASGRFESVEVSREFTPAGVVVTFRVAERPTIESLQILGNKKYSETDLRKDLPLGQGDPLNPALIERGRQALQNKYQSDGYDEVRVTVDPAALARREVIYTIVEGPQVIVTKVSFEGNHYFNDLSLKLRTSTKAKLWPFITGGLNQEKIDRDVQLIRGAYVADGFLDAEVAARISRSDDRTTATVTFVIREGPRYRVNNVLFEGNRVFTDGELARRLALRQGTFFTALALRRDIETIENTYGEIGYIEATVEASKRYLNPEAPTPDWAGQLDAGQPALLNLVFTITERDQYRIGEIRIRGNSITQERVIRRELSFRPEQIYNSVAVERSRSRLQELRLFEDIAIAPVPTPQEDVKDVLVDVKEGKTAEFLVGVGVSSSSGLLGTVSFTQRNFDILAWPTSLQDFLKDETFKGAGQTLTVVAEPGTELMRFRVGWSTPYIYDLPYSLGVDGYLFERGRESYDEMHLGVQSSLGHRFQNRWYGEVSTRLEGVDINADDDAPIEVNDDDGNHTLMGFRGSLVRDRTDSRWNPTTGDRFRFSYEQVVGTDVFGTFNAGYNIYRTVYVDALDRKHVLAGRVAYGQIVGDAPVFERFFGGGIGSVRGFQYRGISPRGTYPSGRTGDDPVGGDMMFFAGTEYSFPLVTDQLRGVVFLDTGTVEKDFGLSTYRASVGVGVRWTIPFFGPIPISLDLGVPLVKDEEDDTQYFHFSLGWTF